MRLITLLVFILMATHLQAQEVDGVYYRSVVDNLIKRTCSKSDIPLGAISQGESFIRFKVASIKANGKRVKFILLEDHGASVRVEAKGFYNVDLGIPKDWIRQGRSYVILTKENCKSVLEYYYQDAAITEAVIYDCCEQGNL